MDCIRNDFLILPAMWVLDWVLEQKEDISGAGDGAPAGRASVSGDAPLLVSCL